VFGYERTMRDAVSATDAAMAADGFASCRRTGELSADRVLAEQSQCEGCGNLGHVYRAYRRGARHRAVAICRGCKHTHEV
jgi:hypothetical protein